MLSKIFARLANFANLAVAPVPVDSETWNQPRTREEMEAFIARKLGRLEDISLED